MWWYRVGMSGWGWELEALKELEKTTIDKSLDPFQ